MEKNKETILNETVEKNELENSTNETKLSSIDKNDNEDNQDIVIEEMKIYNTKNTSAFKLNADEELKDSQSFNAMSPKKQSKQLKSQNNKIKKILKKILKHIKYLDKEIIIFKKFNNKNKAISLEIQTLINNFQETHINLKKERDFLEQKHLDNKILLDKLIDKIKNN